MIKKITNTRYADLRDPSGRIREGVWCDLECGHHVIRYYRSRSTYTRAQCPWCNLEKEQGERYVRNSIQYRMHPDEEDYIPESLALERKNKAKQNQ